MQNIIEYMREESIKSLFQMKGFSSSWDKRAEYIKKYLPTYSPRQVLDLGDNLSDIFRITSEEGRSQSSVSGGGAIWEGLVCWYLNLCLIGTRTIVIKHKKQLIPSPISDAIAVRYNTFTSNTESDLVAITFPDKEHYHYDKYKIKVKNDLGSEIPTEIRKKYNFSNIINALTDIDFNNLEIHVIQCKTNWNDNAQIPMLWNMIYSSKGFKDTNISLGRNGYSISDIKNFTYSFVTVPTTSKKEKEKFNPKSTCVLRVQYLSGGNYWGEPSKSGVSNSIKEILNRNFSNSHSQSLLVNLKEQLKLLNTEYVYFKI